MSDQGATEMSLAWMPHYDVLHAPGDPQLKNFHECTGIVNRGPEQVVLCVKRHEGEVAHSLEPRQVFAITRHQAEALKQQERLHGWG